MRHFGPMLGKSLRRLKGERGSTRVPFPTLRLRHAFDDCVFEEERAGRLAAHWDKS